VKLSATSVVLRPRGMLEVLDLALRVRGRDRAVYRRVALTTLVPAATLCVTLALLGVAPWILWLLALVSAWLVEGAFTGAAGELMFTSGRMRSSTFWPRLHEHVLTRALALSTIALSTLLLLTPWVAARLLFVPEVLQLEGVAGFAALRRAAQVTSGRLGAHVGMALALLGARAVYVALFVGLGVTVADLVLQALPSAQLFAFAQLLALVGWFAAVPYVAVARFLMYIDARTRREGWDLQVRFMAIAAAAVDAA